MLFGQSEVHGNRPRRGGGQVLFTKGYGFADLQWKVPNLPDAKFRLGSVTTEFTAASKLLLEEHSKLSVKDPVKKHSARRSRWLG